MENSWEPIILDGDVLDLRSALQIEQRQVARGYALASYHGPTRAVLVLLHANPNGAGRV